VHSPQDVKLALFRALRVHYRVELDGAFGSPASIAASATVTSKRGCRSNLGGRRKPVRALTEVDLVQVDLEDLVLDSGSILKARSACRACA
jgi:hypothetical protein